MIRERAAQGCAAFFVQRQNRCLRRNTQKAAKPLPTEKHTEGGKTAAYRNGGGGKPTRHLWA